MGEGIVDGILYAIFTYLTRRLMLQDPVNCCLKTSSLTSDDLLGFWHWWNTLPGCFPPFSAGVCGGCTCVFVCGSVCYLACVSECVCVCVQICVHVHMSVFACLWSYVLAHMSMFKVFIYLFVGVFLSCIHFCVFAWRLKYHTNVFLRIIIKTIKCINIKLIKTEAIIIIIIIIYY